MPQYSSAERLGIAASLVAAGLVGVFILGMHYASSPNPNAPATDPSVIAAAPATLPASNLSPAGSTAVSRDAQRHLDAAESLLAQAVVVFQGAGPTAGTPAEMALEQAKLISHDLADAQAFIQTHQDFTPEANLRSYTSYTFAVTTQTLPLRPGLDDLAAALLEIQKVPHALGGARDKAVNDIAQIATAIRVAPTPAPARVLLTPEALNALLTPTPTPDRFKPFRFAPAPAGSADLVLTIKTIRSTALPELASITPADISPPLRSFSINTRANADRPFENASEAGYTYFVDANQKTIAREVLRADRYTGKPTVYSRTLLTPPITPDFKYLADILPALLHLATLDQVKSGSYEPRLLSITYPTPTEAAFWLVSDKGAPDLIYTFNTAALGIPNQKLLTPAEFLAALQAPAKNPPPTTNK